MIKDNQSITLRTYDLYPERYRKTTGHDMKWSGALWVDEFLGLLPKGSVILEVGSAAGRDAEYIEKKGFKVIRTDASQGFIKYMNERNQEAELYNPVLAKYTGKYDAIFAAAVLLHFDEEQLEEVLSNLITNLPPKGLFLFWTKKGEGEELISYKMRSPRYFKYWMPGAIRPILRRHGLTILKEGETEEGKWLHYIVRKD